MDREIEVSVVLPCLNEEKTLGVCIKKINEVFSQEEIKGEIIVVDNGSLDRSREIAESLGVKVVSEPIQGYGAAYLRGLREVKGRYIIIGDSDDTYNFSDIPRFLKPLKEGYDFVIGSRFRGKMHKKAMPWSHRYIGNPILSGMFGLFFHIRLSDVLCGIRAFTYEVYEKMGLRTLGMEFATEMVVSTLMSNLKICEIPIDYHPRLGKSKLRPFSDAWHYIRFMLLYCPLWLYFIPGLLGSIFGIGILLILLRGPFLFLRHQWDIHAMVFGAMLFILSYQILNIGIFAHAYAVKEKFLNSDKFTLFFQRYFSLEKGLILGIFLLFLGAGINILIFIEWFSKHFGPLARIKESILAMTLLISGLQTIFSSFFIDLLFLKKDK